MVDLDNAAQVGDAIAWWVGLTEGGGEGMVVKPYEGMLHTTNGTLTQPGLKCRGQAYLRIIYGADYTATEQLTRLRERRLGRKRSLALREHALGLVVLRAPLGDRQQARHPAAGAYPASVFVPGA